MLTDFTWLPTDEETYTEMLEVLPPAAMARGRFLVGEPMDHRGENGTARFTVYQHKMGAYSKGSRPITIAEFDALV